MNSKLVWICVIIATLGCVAIGVLLIWSIWIPLGDGCTPRVDGSYWDCHGTSEHVRQTAGLLAIPLIGAPLLVLFGAWISE